MSVKTVGSKAEVFHGTAVHTSGNLFKKDLLKTAKGRIVSKKKHAQGKKAIKRLFSLGYKPKKGQFTLMRKSKSTKGKKTRKHRGGDHGAVAPEHFADASGGVGAALKAMGMK
jgi:hypothetical protein